MNVVTGRQTDILYCHSGYLNEWFSIMGRENYCQMATRKTRQGDIHISSTGPHWGPSDPSLEDNIPSVVSYLILTILHFSVNTKSIILSVVGNYDFTNRMMILYLIYWTYAQMDVSFC